MGVKFTTHIYLVASVRMSGAKTSSLPIRLRGMDREKFRLYKFEEFFFVKHFS